MRNAKGTPKVVKEEEGAGGKTPGSAAVVKEGISKVGELVWGKVSLGSFLQGIEHDERRTRMDR